jgi:tetratricopeptide (TPR) repeat protein
MPNAHFDRALLLYEQTRYPEAEQELRRELAADPNHARAIALLAICLAHLKRFPEATESAQQAIATAPNLPFAHYALASVLYDCDRLPEAEHAIGEALRLDPQYAAYYALLAGIKFDQRQWQAALDLTEQGLQFDPAHLGCLNVRSMALVKLNRIDAAATTIAETLRQHPDDAVAHANQGWVFLEQRCYPEAMQSFREALRLNPTLEWAREGMIQALKAQNPIYGWILRYFLWISKLDTRTKWIVIFAGVFVVRILRTIARQNPALQPILFPVIGAYLLFVLLTWIADPLSTLLLRLNPYGRLILSKSEIQASNWVGAAIGLTLLLIGLAVITGNPAVGVGAFVAGLLIIPISAVFHCPGRSRRTMAIYTSVLAAIGVLGFLLVLVQSGVSALAAIALGLFLVGTYLSGWIANFLMLRRSSSDSNSD